ncbi:hypothetical protein [Pyrobaculum sp.]
MEYEVGRLRVYTSAAAYLRAGLGWADEKKLREAPDLFFTALDKLAGRR